MELLRRFEHGRKRFALIRRGDEWLITVERRARDSSPFEELGALTFRSESEALGQWHALVPVVPPPDNQPGNTRTRRTQ
jgi:hypothetical protein